jgi:hypothetical protein
MTLVISLIIAGGVLIIGYIAVMVYIRWRSMADELRKLREDAGELRADIHQRLQLAEQKSRLHYDSIYKSLADLQENIERLRGWQLMVDKIVADYNAVSQGVPKPQEQQTLHLTPHKRGRRGRKP